MTDRLNVAQALKTDLEHLHSDEPAKAAHALAHLCLLVGQGLVQDKQLPSDMAGHIHYVLTDMVPHEASDVRKNALAFLTAVMKNVETGKALVQAPQAYPEVWRAVSAHRGDRGTLLNGLYCLAELATAAPACMDAFLATGTATVIETVNSTDDEPLQEAAMHVLCHCASHTPECHAALRARGALGAAVGVLESSVPDVQVRGAMLLGMLVSRDAAAQADLAALPDAVPRLLRIVRESGDADAKSVASNLFKLLIANPQAKLQVEAALRSDQNVYL